MPLHDARYPSQILNAPRNFGWLFVSTRFELSKPSMSCDTSRQRCTGGSEQHNKVLEEK